MTSAVCNLALSISADLPSVLAQSARAKRASGDVLEYLAILLVAAIVIVAIGLIARKYLAGPIESTEGEAVFDLSELRRMHREGVLNDEEFQAARAAALIGGAEMLTPPADASDTSNDTTDAAPTEQPGHAAPPLGPGAPDDPADPPPEAHPQAAPEATSDTSPDAPSQPPPASPTSRDIELGPELLKPEEPARKPDPTDKPNPDAQAPDNPPNN